MGERQTPWWAGAWEFIVVCWKRIRSPSDIIHVGRSQLADLREPLQDDFRRTSNMHKGMVARIQQVAGVSPTEGRELIRDLHLTKCRSAGVGAPRPSTSPTRGQMDEVQLLLSAQPADILDENWTVEEVRALTRAAIRDILARR